jgi:hypothetical protein
VKAEHFVALAGLVVLLLAVIRIRRGRGAGHMKGLGLSISAQTKDQTSIDMRGISAGRDVTMEAETILASDVTAGRDVAARGPTRSSD